VRILHRRRAAASLIALAAVLAACDDGPDELAVRRAEVARRGAEVMPFDLDATTHTFTPTDDGGIQTVTADDPGDTEEIELIRRHLRDERDAFARGDYDDPAAIHGHDMEGVDELRRGHDDISVTYAELPDGAALTYRTARTDLVDAIHAWFERQLADHGDHARSG
jgi:hypothetical protein